MRSKGFFYSLSVVVMASSVSVAAPPAATPPAPLDSFDQQLASEVSRIEHSAESTVQDKDKWLAEQKEAKRELAEMLGLDPMPPRGGLHATKTGEFEHEGIIVEKLHYQSVPGLYVTANLYRPKEASGQFPAVLYLCGHANKKKGDISYGNKTGYEHHGVWYAKHGFVCLMIDTVQLGEIRGSHQGTFAENRWDWISRGYTPAGVEAWAGIRGIDYLITRPEVNPKKIGVTGRSGGGAYSWWVSALDERVTAAAPTSGITTLRDHVVHKCVYGHCDCMFMVNTYGWDYDRVASLIAPRPLLIVNTDQDKIFPVDGVFDLFQRTRSVYRMLGIEKNLGLHVAAGGHEDLQPVNTGEFHWMTRHLKGEPADVTYDGAAVRSIPMEKLQVFDKIPDDQKNTTIDQSFVPLAKAPSAEAWNDAKPALMEILRKKVFATWPEKSSPQVQASGEKITAQDASLRKFTVRPLGPDTEPVLDLYLIQPAGAVDLAKVDLHILDTAGWTAFSERFGPLFPALFPEMKDKAAATPAIGELVRPGVTTAYFCPRGEGPFQKAGTPKDQIQLRRSFYLTGSTLESWQVWDIRAAVAALRSLPEFKEANVSLDASRNQAANGIYAALFEPAIKRLDLREVPSTHLNGDAPSYLNILKYMDIPIAAAMAAERAEVSIHGGNPDEWKDGVALAAKSAGAESKDHGLKIQTAADDSGKKE